jgi:hypothetical protein
LRPGDAEVYMTQGSTTLLNDMLSQVSLAHVFIYSTAHT